MIRHAISVLALAAVVVMGASCANNEKMKASTATAGNPDEAFVTQLGHGSNAEVKLSEMALSKSGDPKVREFAQRMVTDHTKINKELTHLGHQLHLRVPSSPDGAHARAASSMAKLHGGEFDRAYMAQMVSDHAETISLLQDMSKNAKEPQLRDWASKQIPTIQEHLDMARQTQSSLTPATGH